MADIMFGDNIKHSIRLAALWLRREYGKSKGDIHNDMMNCGNPVVKEIHSIIAEASSQIEEKYQRAITMDYPELGLWIAYNDTAYRQFFFYMLKKLMDKKDELMPFIMEYYVEPKDMYINKWTASKNKTDKLKQSGELADVPGNMSFEETFLTPMYQMERNKAILNDIQIEENAKRLEEEIAAEKKKRKW
jgi:hypothetical protein